MHFIEGDRYPSILIRTTFCVRKSAAHLLKQWPGVFKMEVEGQGVFEQTIVIDDVELLNFILNLRGILFLYASAYTSGRFQVSFLLGFHLIVDGSTGRLISFWQIGFTFHLFRLLLGCLLLLAGSWFAQLFCLTLGL